MLWRPKHASPRSPGAGLRWVLEHSESPAEKVICIDLVMLVMSFHLNVWWPFHWRNSLYLTVARQDSKCAERPGRSGTVRVATVATVATARSEPRNSSARACQSEGLFLGLTYKDLRIWDRSLKPEVFPPESIFTEKLQHWSFVSPFGVLTGLPESPRDQMRSSPGGDGSVEDDGGIPGPAVGRSGKSVRIAKGSLKIQEDFIRSMWELGKALWVKYETPRIFVFLGPGC